jgi:hypothetical protein
VGGRIGYHVQRGDIGAASLILAEFIDAEVKKARTDPPYVVWEWSVMGFLFAPRRTIQAIQNHTRTRTLSRGPRRMSHTRNQLTQAMQAAGEHIRRDAQTTWKLFQGLFQDFGDMDDEENDM